MKQLGLITVIFILRLTAQPGTLAATDYNFTSWIQADNSRLLIDYGIESFTLISPGIEVGTVVNQLAVGNKTAFKSTSLAYLSTNLITLGLKYLIDRPRPPRNYQPRLWNTRITPSFPSGHTASSAAWAAALAHRYPEYVIPLAGYALISGYSQIYVGNHYLGDVLAGLIIGGVLGVAIDRQFPAQGSASGSPTPTLRIGIEYNI